MRTSPERERLIGALLTRLADHRPIEVMLIIGWAAGHLIDAEPGLYEPLMAVLSGEVESPHADEVRG